MRFLRFLILGLLLSHSGAAFAAGPACDQLFEKSYKATEFIIHVSGKKQSAQFLEAAHTNLTSNFEISNLNKILNTVKNEGIDKLSREERKFIIKFRQNSSFLRSIFQTSDKHHKSPADFGSFVRDFGVLKDYLLMSDNDGARTMAMKILKKYSELDFDTLIKDSKPASQKSVRNYFKEILDETKKIMARPAVTVDEVHDVRKNLRDVLRYMQITNEVGFAKASGAKTLNLGQAPDLQDTIQIDFLKKTNEKLGEICDQNAALILNGELSEDTIIAFPEKIRPRVVYFLENFVIQAD